jgi:hypothetical protein
VNRGSFSSVSSHHSYLYPSLNEENDTTKSYHLDNTHNNSRIYPTSYTKYTQEDRTASAGSTTPSSSWLSPETPTAVLFQQKDSEVVTKRKSSIDSPTLRSTRRLKVVKLEQD